MTTKTKQKSRKAGKKRLVLKPFEDDTSLAAMLRIKLRGWHTGAYILTQQGSSSLERDCLKFVFGFECKGIHSCLPLDQVDKVFDNLEVGLRDLPPGERITFHLGAFSSDKERQQQLAKLINDAPSDELKFLLMGERARLRELARRGLREPKYLRVYVSYTIQPRVHGNDFIEKSLAWLLSFWHQFKGEAEQYKTKQLRKIIEQAFKDGWQRWFNLLTNSMGLQVSPMNEDDLWRVLWNRLNLTEPEPIPQLLVIDEQGLREEIYRDIHPSSLLICKEQPIADREWVYVNKHYVGALTFLSKPAGWSNKLAQLRYLWDVIARDEVVDTEIICQLTPANQSIVKTDNQRLMKQSNVVAITAAGKKSIDPVAQIKVKRTVAAQERMYEGDMAVRSSTVVLVHRKSLNELHSATSYLEPFFRHPAKVVREKEYTWKIWLETLPIVWNQQLVKPFDRRLTYLTSEVQGVAPLVCTRTIDKEGLELIAEDGGTPIFLDLFTQHRNLGIFATTRAGKSVLVSGILTQALARGWPVVALDFPKEDGTSTFSDYTHFLAECGAYFDISKKCNNLFEIPDLRHLSPDIQRERLEDYKDFLLTALMTMIVGEGSVDQSAKIRIRSMLVRFLHFFFKDREIMQRYEQALSGGFGSPAWQNIPTLRDFVSFCTIENVGIKSTQGDIRGSLQQIQLSLNSWIESRIGKAIAFPSNFRTDAPLIVFALRNLSNDDDAAVMALAAYAAAKRRTLEYPDSILFLDEGPILFQYEDVAQMIGRQCANGAKAGVRVILTGQDPNTIADSVAGSRILQNLSVRLIGRIEPTACKYFENIFDYPKEIIAHNATEAFFPKKEGIYSRWLLDTNGMYTLCRYYPAYAGLAVVANNPPEQEARDYFSQLYPDKYEALAKFSEYLISWIKEGKKPFPIPKRITKTGLTIAS